MLLWEAMSREARMRGAQENLLIAPAIGATRQGALSGGWCDLAQVARPGQPK
jgi:hypothetical protein